MTTNETLIALADTANQESEFGPLLDLVKENRTNTFIEVVESIIKSDEALLTGDTFKLLDKHFDLFQSLTCDELSCDHQEAFEILEKIDDDDRDFESSADGCEYRFIHDNDIETIHHGEVCNDAYHIGMFAAWFIADHLNLPLDVIETLQANEAYDGIGKMILNSDTKAFAKAYSDQDGYAHHFATYNGESIELGSYQAFRTN